MKWLSALLIYFVLFTGFIYAQSFPDTQKKIKIALEDRDYRTARNALESLRKKDAKIFELNNFDYLLARVDEWENDFAAAMANYQTVVDRDSVLKEYALRHLAEIARSSGNLMLERIFLQEILTVAPDSLLNDATNARLARSFIESGNFETAISLLSSQKSEVSSQKENQKPKTENQTNIRLQRENLVLLAESFLQINEPNKAREIFVRLIDELPNQSQPDDFALAAAKGLDLLDNGSENFGKSVAQLPENEHLKRARIYNFNRDFNDARLHYQAVVKRFPESESLPDAMYQIGRGYGWQDNYNEAINWYERLIEQFPNDSLAADAMMQAASGYAKVNKIKESTSRYRKVIAQYPDYERPERAYLNIVDVYRDMGEAGDALKWTTKTENDFKDKLPEALALFAEARIHLARKDWQLAFQSLDALRFKGNLGGTSVPGGTTKEEVAYLRGYVLEKLNRFPEAVDTYLSIPDGRAEYYGWRATERLKELTADDLTKEMVRSKFKKFRDLSSQAVTTKNADEIRIAAQNALRLIDVKETRNQLLETLKQTYTFLPDYKKVPDFKLQEFGRKEVLKQKRAGDDNQNRHKLIADELLFLGLYDEGTPEFETAEATDKGQTTKDKSYTLAVFYKRGDMANRAVGFIESLWRGIPADYQIELIPKNQIELLYPAPYADSLTKFAPERQVDPRFVLSIMRQESRFRADVKSVAAARGLMQFISSTSNTIASELGRKNFAQDELYHPPTAVLFGSQYLSDLYKLFPNQTQAVAASYNGGEDNMERWLKRANSNIPDQYVPEIAYSQSKDYVYKVMQNYRMYQIIYDEDLKAKLSN